jgi:hypothetical protein
VKVSRRFEMALSCSFIGLLLMHAPSREKRPATHAHRLSKKPFGVNYKSYSSEKRAKSGKKLSSSSCGG